MCLRSTRLNWHKIASLTMVHRANSVSAPPIHTLYPHISILGSQPEPTGDRCHTLVYRRLGKAFDGRIFVGPQIAAITVRKNAKRMYKTGEPKRAMVKDLVCGMEVNENATNYSVVFEGEMYFFCSEGCMAEFKRRSHEYLNPHSPCCGKPSEKKSDV